jgi:hypothetical protein
MIGPAIALKGIFKILEGAIQHVDLAGFPKAGMIPCGSA